MSAYLVFSAEHLSKNPGLGARNNLEVPRARSSISGAKSATNPETPRKRSQMNF